jgi:hypothetical protein
MEEGQLVVYFNNCHNRDHVALFGSGAFFDLGTTGRQGLQARDLQPGQPCVVAEWAPDKRIVFDWYSFGYEALLQDEHGAPDRVFYGRLFASETMAKQEAADSARYAPLFRSTGHLKSAPSSARRSRRNSSRLGSSATVHRRAAVARLVQ